MVVEPRLYRYALNSMPVEKIAKEFMSYEKKIFLGFLTAIFAIVPLAGLSVYTIQKLISDQNTIIDVNSQVTLLAQRLRFYNASKTLHIPIYLLTGEQKQVEQFHFFHEKFESTIAELIRLDQDPAEIEIIHTLQKKTQRAFAIVEVGIKRRANGESGESVDKFFRQALVPTNLEIADDAKTLLKAAGKREELARSILKASIARLEDVIVALTILATLLIGGITLLVRKISRQKVLADQHSERISQARKEVIEVVSHDLKNPLTSIFLSTEMAQLGLAQNLPHTQIRECLETTNRSARSMQRLIEGLLDHAKVEAGTLVLDRVDCDVELFLEDVCERFILLAESKQIRFSVKIDADLSPATFDHLRVDQIISNLLGNAFKFTPNGGSVTLLASSDRNYLKISVEDSGRGIPHDQLEHVFDRYWQARESSQQGTGLGLSIAQEIIRAHQGRIWVVSDLGKGSKFTFTLPLRVDGTLQITDSLASTQAHL